MKKRSEDDYENILMMLTFIEQRLSLLESAVGLTEKTCKLCEAPIDIRNARKEALLAELCDQCWEEQNGNNPEDVM